MKKSASYLIAALCAATALLGAAPAAQGAASDPLFVFTPKPSPPPAPPFPPPFGFLEGPCGMVVDPLGRFYVSDYYHDAIDVYDQNADYNAKGVSGATGFLGQLPGIDSLDGPCGLAIAGESLYVNDYHRAVLRYDLSGSSATILGPSANGEHNPTGVATDPATANLYVDQRTYLSAYDPSGAPVMEGPPGSEVPLQIGKGTLGDGYGVAFSQYPGTQGRLYVPDAATDTIEVYDSATPSAGPVQEIDGTETPKGRFVSLRDASIAVDRVTGEIYLTDNLQPQYTERPQAIVYVFAPDGSYEGHLKFLITWGMPAGLAVDNTETPSQGRVYVTSGNSSFGAIYAYGPGAATTAAIDLPADSPPPGAEAGSAGGQAAGAGCVSCKEQAAAFLAPSEQATPQAPSSATAKHHRHHRKAHRRRHHRVKGSR